MAVFVAIVGLLLGAMGAKQAQAANNNTIEQHWELLADTITGQIGEKRLFIKRGDLPGGTTGFEPAPSATMEAVAKVTGAGNGSSGYDIQALDTGGSVIASVPFRGSDSDFTLEKTASPFAWNSSTRAISELKIVPVGTIPGAIDLKKAYFKFRQSGTIIKTIGRVPLASKSLGITRDTFGDLPDLLVYDHVAADFNPAPTVQLRVTATATLCTLKVALVNLGTGLPIPGSELSFTGLASRISGPLTLNHLNTKYKLQAKAEQTNCGTQSQSGPEQQSGEPGAAGDVLSADLILSQSTADTKGLVRTVGWYPSVTASTTVAQSGVMLGFQFNSPVMSVPNAISSKWLTMVKLSAGSGVGSHLAYASSGSIHTTSPLTNSSSWVALDASIAALPSTATTLDSKSALTGTGAAGTISGSLIRSALHLWDIAAPQLVGSLNLTNPEFSPQASLGSKDTTTCSAALTDYSPVSWTIEIRAGAAGTGAVQRSQTGSGLSPSYTWNGTNASGNSPDGAYACILSAADDSGNAIPTPLPYRTIIVDRVAPTITGFQSSVPRISPTNGPPSSTAFTATISEPVTWTISIAPASGGTPVWSMTRSTTSISEPWDGRYSPGGAAVPDNSYTATLTALDAAGNSSTASAPIVVDKTGPSILDYRASNPFFSPNGDLAKDTSTLLGTLDDAWSGLSWSIEIVKDLNGQVVRTLSGSTTSGHLVLGSGSDSIWTGLEESGSLAAPGLYLAELTVRDGGNNPSSLATSLVLDVAPPVAASLIPSNNGNTTQSSQPLMAMITDDFSEVPIDNVDFVFKNETTGQTFPPVRASTISSDGWAKTVPQSLVPSHRYQVTVNITDAAGNSNTLAPQRSSFSVVTASFNPSAASIPAVSCSLGPENWLANTRIATCPNIALVLPGTTGSLSSSRQAGQGVADQTINLSTAITETDLPGGLTSKQVAVPSQPAAWEDQIIPRRFRVSLSSSSQTLSVPPVSHDLGTVDFVVPAVWSNARIRMDSVNTTPALRTCADPIAATSPCAPDVVTAPYSVWDPPISAAHTSSCDSVLSHKQPFALNVGATGSLTVSMNTARLNATSVDLLYSINGGAVQTLTQPGTGATSYMFQVPGASLVEGAVVDYAFVGRGSFSETTCGAYTTAVAPRYFGYKAIAAQTPTLSAFNIRSTFADAAAQSALQPTAAGQTDPVVWVCENAFTSSTICSDLLPESGNTSSGVIEAEPIKLTASSTSTGYRYCHYSTAGNGFFPPDYESNGLFDNWDPTKPVAWTATAGQSVSPVGQDLRTQSIGAWRGETDGWGRTKVGYVFGVQRSPESTGSGLGVRAWMTYSLRGQAQARFRQAGFIEGAPNEINDLYGAQSRNVVRLVAPQVYPGVYRLIPFLNGYTGTYDGGIQPITGDWSAWYLRNGGALRTVRGPYGIQPSDGLTPTYDSGLIGVQGREFQYADLVLRWDQDYAYFVELRLGTGVSTTGHSEADGVEDFLTDDSNGLREILADELVVARTDGGLWGGCGEHGWGSNS